MSRLAMFGGQTAVPERYKRITWPVVTQADKDAVLRVLETGGFTVGSRAETEISGLEREWAEFVGTRHAVAVSSGTSALGLALAALGVQPGDEVIVPALSFVASGLAPLYQLAVPVFADVQARTFNLDPADAAARVTPRTRAILPVHLHGLPADMDEITAIARKHDLLVVEDSAQAQGARYRDRMTGALGDIGVFSLNAEKSIPTCGEGGLMTMGEPDVAERCRSLRVLGEYTKTANREYVSRRLGWNHKPSAILAAFTRSQLARFSDYQARRDANVTRLLERLSELPGVNVPLVPRDRTHVWHILRVRFDPEAAGLSGVTAGRFRQALRRALRAEGVPVSQYQLMPLPGQPVFQEQLGYGAGYPWKLPGVTPQRYDISEYRQTLAIVEDSLTFRRVHLDPRAGPALDAYADAFCKVWEHLDRIDRLARSLSYEPPWSTTSS
ncbi:MAG: DegT/DnrJ/EryC1/StrS family aminotransferase [Actinomycetota bacterium]